MVMHSGKTYHTGEVSLEAPDGYAVDVANRDNPEDAGWRIWREQAAIQDDIYYFSIHRHGVLVGELFLHDIDLNARESLIGYRVFSSFDRNLGTGRQAIRSLQGFVASETDLERLAVMTAEDNIPSRRMAEHCGFKLVGSSWEDPHLLVYEWKPSPSD